MELVFKEEHPVLQILRRMPDPGLADVRISSATLKDLRAGNCPLGIYFQESTQFAVQNFGIYGYFKEGEKTLVVRVDPNLQDGEYSVDEKGLVWYTKTEGAELIERFARAAVMCYRDNDPMSRPLAELGAALGMD